MGAFTYDVYSNLRDTGGGFQKLTVGRSQTGVNKEV